jgi:hypothetical protein
VPTFVVAGSKPFFFDPFSRCICRFEWAKDLLYEREMRVEMKFYDDDHEICAHNIALRSAVSFGTSLTAIHRALALAEPSLDRGGVFVFAIPALRNGDTNNSVDGCGGFSNSDATAIRSVTGNLERHSSFANDGLG